MPGQEQQQVTVIQQPIVIGGEEGSQPPFLLRGYRFANGRKCPGICFALLILLGGFAALSVITSAFMGSSLFDLLNIGPILSVFIMLFIMLLAVVCIVTGCYFCVGAYRQFKQLPPDHPHRYKYGTGYVLPVLPPQPAMPPATNDNLTTNNLPHGAHGRGSANPSPSFQGPPEGNVNFPHGSPGSKTSPERPPSADLSFQDHRVGYPGQAGPNPAYPPPSPTAPPVAAEDDQPPSYSEIEKNNRY